MARSRKNDGEIRDDATEPTEGAADAEVVPADEIEAVPDAAVEVVDESSADAPAEEPAVAEEPVGEPVADAGEAPADAPADGATGDDSERVAAVIDPESPAPPADEPGAEAAAAEEAPAEETPADEPAAEEEPAAEARPEPEAEAPADAAPARPARTKRVSKLTKAEKRAKRAARKPAPKPAGQRKPIVRLAKPEHERGRRKERRGVVVSSASDKTIVVRVDRVRPDPRYKKVIRRSTKFHAHDERNEAKVGDVVRIVETRPLSKTKTWRLAEVVEAAR